MQVIIRQYSNNVEVRSIVSNRQWAEDVVRELMDKHGTVGQSYRIEAV